MSHRTPHLKRQAAQLRTALAEKNYSMGQGEALELVSRLNGYPSWNVAKQAEAKPFAGTASDGTTIELEIWVAEHRHRHGRDNYYFHHLPTEDEVIEQVNAVSSFEPDEDEEVSVVGVETFTVDIPEELARQASHRLPQGVLGVYEVNMTELTEYDDPQAVPEWRWIEAMAAFEHKRNGTEPGVWEFMVHGDKLRQQLHEVPKLLRPEVDRALSHGAAWVMFHQG